jgi:putative ABC transport system permease protein
MSVGDLVAFALRAVRGHRIRTGLTLLGVAIGVAAVILLTALGDGARRYVMGQFESLGSTMIAVVPGKTETSGAAAFMSVTTKDLTLADAEALARRVQGVQRMAPMSMASETVALGERNRKVAVIGSTSDFLEVRRLKLARGRFLPPGELRRSPAVAVIGTAIARELFPGADPLGKSRSCPSRVRCGSSTAARCSACCSTRAFTPTSPR